MKIGDKIKLNKDVEMLGVIYNKGHIFTIIGDDNIRGLDIEDDNGNKIYECRFIQQDFILYNIKKDRKEKLIKLNDKGEL